MKWLYVLTSVLLSVWFVSCIQNFNNETDCDALIKELEKKEKAALAHIVFLNIKDELVGDELEYLENELQRMQQIKEVQQFELGLFKNLEDKRAMSEYEVVMKMYFEDSLAYRSYQDHPIHNEIKSTLSEYLETPPVTYDYLIQ